MAELAVMEKSSGQLIRVTETEYEGYDLVDVRVYFRDKQDTLRPTRKGISLRRETFGDFADMIAEAREALADKTKEVVSR